MFEDSKSSSKVKNDNVITVESMNANDKIEALELELVQTEENLQFTKAELESSNQEMQSTNEELQSSNEELETSKEELQSVNEELSTINSELQIKVGDLSHANNDMNNLLTGTGIGTIFVDHNKCIVRFTPLSVKLINLIPTDVGRPIAHIVSNFKNYDSLLTDLQGVLDDLVSRKIEVETKDGEWFLMRIRPYRTLENVIEGAVITFLDITEIKKIQNDLEEANSLRQLALIIKDAKDAILVHDLKGIILAWNPSAERLYGRTEAEALGMNIQELINKDEQENELQNFQKFSFSQKIKAYESKRIAKDGRIISISLTATALINNDHKVYAIATTEREFGEPIV